MSSGRFAEQRARNLERARRSGVPESVARLFAAVQEPRCDDEPSTVTFDTVLGIEASRLRQRLDELAPGSTTHDSGGLGGVLETETTITAHRLIAAAEADGMGKTTALLRSALERCTSIPEQRIGPIEKPSFPHAERILNPETGRPIGMWR